MKELYFDHAASSPVSAKTAERFLALMTEYPANPSSLHLKGRELKEKIDRAKQSILKSLDGTDEYQIIFTSGATEANNILLKGLKLTNGQRVWGSSADHPSLWKPLERRAREEGKTLGELPLKKSGISYSQIEEGPASLVAISPVNNHSGHYFNPLELREKFPTSLLHLDITQLLGKHPFSLQDCKADSVVFSGHKLGLPKGIGALVYKKSLELHPLCLGGNQEEGLRPGTLNGPLILLLAEYLSNLKFNENQIKEITLFEERIRTHPSIGFIFEGERSPYIQSFALKNLPGDVLVRNLEELGIFVNTTSACSSKKADSHPAWKAYGVPQALRKNFVRVSFSPESKSEDIKKLQKIFFEVLEDLDFL